MTWNDKTLGEVLTLKRGHDLPDSERRSGIVPVVSSSGITGWHDEPRAKGPGVVTGRYGTIGEVFYIQGDYWPLNTALYVIDFKENDPRFVAYLLENTLKAYQSDKAAVPGVNRNVLHKLRVRVPEGGLQRKIVGILAAYDDHIENNARRIAVVEEMSRQIHREWFIRLRFPGREHTRLIQGVPEGWRQMSLFDAAIPTYGFAFKSDLFNEAGDGLPLARIRDVLAGETKTFTGEDGPPDRRISNGDFLIGMDGDFHMGLWAGGEAWLNQRVVRISSRGEVADHLLFWMMVEPIRQLNAMITGSTVAHLGAKELKTIRLVVPSGALLTQANEVFANAGALIVKLKLANARLRAARDILLPRLMSGELAV